MKKYYLNLFISALLLSLCSIESAWAKGEVTFYAKLKTQVASSCSNMGKVYAGTSNSAGTYNASSSTSGELNSGQKESGTTSADVGPFYAFAQENDNYVFEGWKETNDANADWYSRDKTCQITVTSTAQSSGGYTKTLYAFFSEKKKVTVTMPSTEKGSYTYSCADGNGTVNTTTAKEITTDAAITLTATPVSGYKFFGWYTLNGTTESFLNYSATYTTTFTSNTTLYAKFIPSSTAVFTLRGTAQYFYDLNTANSAAVASSNKIIVPTANGTIPAGNYTISGGVTLLIPFDDANTLYTTEPTWPKQAPSGQSAYRKLTLKSGVNIVVNGAISVSAQSQGNQPYGGCVYGKYGQIDMESGSTITINSSANLYCWGYITGGGAITAKSGAKVYEDFQLTCWRGGTAASTMNSNASSKSVFPLAQYYIQNIEAPLTLEAGALEYTCTAVTALSSVWDATVQIVGTNSGLFHISSGSITKWYDAAKDRQMYSINGNTKLGAVVVDVSVTISSEKFVLPITNNMDITIASGTLTCDQRVALSPGARIVIDEGATVKFDSGSKLFIYDKDEWKGSYNGSMVSYNYPGNATHLPAPYSPTCSSIKTLRTFDKMDDAELDVNGTLEMTGALYTTIHGANVRSSNGTGIIKYKTSAGTESVTYQAFQGGSGGSEITWQNISITSAKLHNSTTVTSAYGADLEYLATAGAAANTTITYANGHWGWVEIWKNGNTVLKVSNTCVRVNNATASGSPALSDYALTGHTASWTTTENNTNQEVIHTITNTPITYNITLNTNEGTINSGNVTSYTYGVGATLPSDVTRANHIFEGWFDNSGLTGSQVETISTTATGDKKFWAKWTLNAADITWRVDGNDEVTQVAYGSNPVYPSGTPSKGPKYDYTYTFEGWSDGTNTYAKDATLPEVTGPATYTALFQAHLRYYTVTWKNWDGTILETDQDEEGGMQYGATPSYDGKTPTKDGDGKRFYTFKGWYPEIEENSVDGNKEYVAQYNMSIAVDENDGPLEITTDETAVTTTVQIAGKLNVAPAATLTTEDLILEGTPNSSGEIIIGGTVTATRAYFDFSNGTEGFKARTWYAVAVPWQVDVPAYDKEHNGVYIKTDEGDFVQQELGQTFDLIYYDGALRASQGVNKAWNYVEDDQLEHSKHYVMMPGRAYMIYLTADAQTIRFERKEGADLLTNTLAVETYDLGTGNGKDANWNGIANPATYHAYINASVKNYTTDVMNVGQVYDAKTKKYSVVNMSTQSLVVGQPIFVQATESNASVVAYADKNDAFHAPRRAAKAAASLTRYELYLAPSMDIATDQIVVRMNEGKEDDVYTVGQDLVKMGVSDLVPQMWIDRYDSKMCINTIAPVDNTADYPLGIFVPKNGEYDIFLDDEPDSKSTLYLTYDGEAIWNLSNGAYVANLEKGTNTHYGLRISAKSPQIATGIDEAVVDAQGDTRKVMINETVYIIRGGKVYSADGQLVK